MKNRKCRCISEITKTKADIVKYSETSEETVVCIIVFFENKKILIKNSRSFRITNFKLLSVLIEEF